MRKEKYRIISEKEDAQEGKEQKCLWDSEMGIIEEYGGVWLSGGEGWGVREFDTISKEEVLKPLKRMTR